MNTSYYIFFPVRDGENTIEKVMKSLINQTIKPQKIIVTEDGSTDKTADILDKFKKDYPDLLKIIHTGSKTRDFKRIPRLWNMCLDETYEFHMIAAGDCIFERQYAEKILNEMKKDSKLVIASGDFGKTKSKSPHGAGRIVRQSWFFANYKKYHEIVGYESEIIHRAMNQDLHISILHNARFDHVDKLGHSHNFSEFGQGMKALGYHPLYVLGRCCLQFCRGDEINRRGVWNMLWSYVKFKPEQSGYYSKFPEEIRKEIRMYQWKKIKGFLKKRIFHNN